MVIAKWGISGILITFFVETHCRASPDVLFHQFIPYRVSFSGKILNAQVQKGREVQFRPLKSSAKTYFRSVKISERNKK